MILTNKQYAGIFLIIMIFCGISSFLFLEVFKLMNLGMFALLGVMISFLAHTVYMFK